MAVRSAAADLDAVHSVLHAALALMFPEGSETGDGDAEWDDVRINAGTFLLGVAVPLLLTMGGKNHAAPAKRGAAFLSGDPKVAHEMITELLAWKPPEDHNPADEENNNPRVPPLSQRLHAHRAAFDAAYANGHFSKAMSIVASCARDPSARVSGADARAGLAKLYPGRHAGAPPDLDETVLTFRRDPRDHSEPPATPERTDPPAGGPRRRRRRWRRRPRLGHRRRRRR